MERPGQVLADPSEVATPPCPAEEGAGDGGVGVRGHLRCSVGKLT